MVLKYIPVNNITDREAGKIFSPKLVRRYWFSRVGGSIGMDRGKQKINVSEHRRRWV